jgi:hypothetical protein
MQPKALKKSWAVYLFNNKIEIFMKKLTVIFITFLSYLNASYTQNILDPYFFYENYPHGLVQNTFYLNNELYTVVNRRDPETNYFFQQILVSDKSGNVIDSIYLHLEGLPQENYWTYCAAIFECGEDIGMVLNVSTEDRVLLREKSSNGVIRLVKYDRQHKLKSVEDMELNKFESTWLKHFREGGMDHFYGYRKLESYDADFFELCYFTFDGGKFSEPIYFIPPEFSPIPFIPEYKERAPVYQMLKKGAYFYLISSTEIFKVDEEFEIVEHLSSSFLANTPEFRQYGGIFGPATVFEDKLHIISRSNDTHPLDNSPIPDPRYFILDENLKIDRITMIKQDINDYMRFDMRYMSKGPAILGDKIFVAYNTRNDEGFSPNELAILIANRHTSELEHQVIFSYPFESWFYVRFDHTLIDSDSSVVFNALFTPFYSWPISHYLLIKVDVNGNVFIPGGVSTEDIPLVAASLRLMGNPSDGYFDLRTTGLTLQAALHLYDMSGRVVHTAPVSDDLPVLADLSHLNSGVYPFSITNRMGKVVLSGKWVRK